MAKIVLKEVGDSHTMVVRKCERIQGKFGDEVMFVDGQGDVLYMPGASADRQLARVFGEAWAYADAVGNALTFYRSPNNKSPNSPPYWNIRPSEPGEAHSRSSTRVVESDAPAVKDDGSERRKAIVDSYLGLYRHIRTALPQESAEAVQAATATIWITWDKRGIQPVGKLAGRADAPTEPERAPEVKHPAPSGKRITPPQLPDSLPPANHDDDLPF